VTAATSRTTASRKPPMRSWAVRCCSGRGGNAEGGNEGFREPGEKLHEACLLRIKRRR